MKALPSKELVSAVLGKEARIISNAHGDITQVWNPKAHNWNTHTKGRWEVLDINIYELMHMMKEWLFYKDINKDIAGTFLYTHHYNNESSDGNTLDSITVFLSKKRFPDTHSRSSAKRFSADTEPEAVTKACEWILKESR